PAPSPASSTPSLPDALPIYYRPGQRDHGSGPKRAGPVLPPEVLSGLITPPTCRLRIRPARTGPTGPLRSRLQVTAPAKGPPLSAESSYNSVHPSAQHGGW